RVWREKADPRLTKICDARSIRLTRRALLTRLFRRQRVVEHDVHTTRQPRHISARRPDRLFRQIRRATHPREERLRFWIKARICKRLTQSLPFKIDRSVSQRLRWRDPGLRQHPALPRLRVDMIDLEHAHVLALVAIRESVEPAASTTTCFTP